MHSFELERRFLGLIARGPKPVASIAWALDLRLREFRDLASYLRDSGFIKIDASRGPLGREAGITPDGEVALDLVGSSEPVQPLQGRELVALAMVAVRPNSIGRVGRCVDLGGMDAIAFFSGLVAQGLLSFGAQGEGLDRTCYLTEEGRRILSRAGKGEA